MAASSAVKAKEAIFADPASQVLPEFAFDEPGQRPFLFLTARQESLELFGDHLIQDSLSRLPGNVFEFASTHARALCNVYSRALAYSLQKLAGGWIGVSGFSATGPVCFFATFWENAGQTASTSTFAGTSGRIGWKVSSGRSHQRPRHRQGAEARP
jgi:hypothetical protein